jgi:hypothetical protein
MAQRNGNNNGGGLGWAAAGILLVILLGSRLGSTPEPAGVGSEPASYSSLPALDSLPADEEQLAGASRLDASSDENSPELDASEPYPDVAATGAEAEGEDLRETAEASLPILNPTRRPSALADLDIDDLDESGADDTAGAAEIRPAASNSYAEIGTARTGCAENGSCYGDISSATGRPRTVHVRGYYRRDGTYVRSHYRSRPRR